MEAIIGREAEKKILGNLLASGTVSENHPSRLARLCLDKPERVPSYILKERLAPAQYHRMNNQTQLIDQVRIHEAGYKTGSPDDISVLSRTALQLPKSVEVTDDLRFSRPRDTSECGR